MGGIVGVGNGFPAPLDRLLFARSAVPGELTIARFGPAETVVPLLHAEQ
jgi:hypothetical protein